MSSGVTVVTGVAGFLGSAVARVLAELGGRVTGHEPFLTLDALRMSAHHMYYSSARAEAELGYTARPYRAALAEALDWFRAAGMIG